ncbi:MAG: hypothetical protein ACKOAD_04070 [Gammaproteobacteria bacterium]
MKKYKACGINGYNYEPYGFAKGEVDQGAQNIGVIMTKIQNDQCDVFIEKYEVLSGFAAIGQNYLAAPTSAPHKSLACLRHLFT